ncbi:hypothetical protein GCM10027200_87560 [Lentzea nigeriaca]
MVPRFTDESLIERLPTSKSGSVDENFGKTRPDRLAEHVTHRSFHLAYLGAKLAEQGGRAQSAINHARDVELLPKEADGLHVHVPPGGNPGLQSQVVIRDHGCGIGHRFEQPFDRHTEHAFEQTSR